MKRIFLLCAALLSVRCISSGQLADESVLNGDHPPPMELGPRQVEGGLPLPAGPLSWDDKAVFTHPSVLKWRSYFVDQDVERFQRFLQRGQKYKAYVEKVLVENGIPKSLYYLAIIESGFVTQANSHAGAVGPWQFMPGTASRYGLLINDYVDERQDPLRATRAAAQYLRSLHDVFQSWYLAMAAYNAGEARIMVAIMRHGTRDYWKLVAKGALPPETRDYVPKFLAALWVGERGQIKLEGGQDFDVYPVDVPKFVRLSDVAKAAGMSVDTLRLYNPNLISDHTPEKTYQLWLPTSLRVNADVFAELQSDVVKRIAHNKGHKKRAAKKRFLVAAGKAKKKRHGHKNIRRIASAG